MPKPTAKQKRHFQAVAELGCIVPVLDKDGEPTGETCGMDAEIHHVRTGLGMGQRDHDMVIPLCCWHHRHAANSIHNSKKEFEKAHGTELELLGQVVGML